MKFLRHISTFLRRGILVALGGVLLAAVAVEMSEAVVRAYNLAPGETCECVADSDTSVCRGDDALCGNAGDDRPAINAFIAEVVAATKHTEDAWRDTTYVSVCEAPELPSVQDAVRRAARENLEKDGKERKRLEEAWNAERKANGLPDFTREEMMRKWDDHLLELKIAEMAALRIKMNEGGPTTELDRAYDVERAKVEMMGFNVDRYMAERRCKTRKFKAPENLRQLIGVKALGRVLLPDGEKDLIDGWGHEYGYRIEKRARPDGTEREYPAVISAGADGVFGTDDDIDSRKLFELEKLLGK